MIYIILFLLNLFSTLFMTGLIWFVQIVHYPLFDRVGESFFVNYEKDHSFLTTLVVGPPMLIEAFTTALLILYRPTFLKSEYAYLGLIFLIIIWLSTVLLQVPQHNILTNNFDSNAYINLVKSNWIRTIFWSFRSILLLYVLYIFMKKFN